uniref:Uncharacterized protein n=2 Tax=Anguilla anguilla TaxID=7936 RepID=A0A0E9RVE5_ANGAN
MQASAHRTETKAHSAGVMGKACMINCQVVCGNYKSHCSIDLYQIAFHSCCLFLYLNNIICVWEWQLA